MSRLSLSLFASALVLTAVVAAHGDDHAHDATKETQEKIVKALQGASTVGAYIKKIQPRLSPAQFLFLREKAKGHERDRLQVIVQAGDRLLVKSGRAAIPFGFDKAIDTREMEVSVNNRIIRAEVGEDPERVWQKITSVLPDGRSTSYVPLVLPEAHAYLPTMLSAAVALTGMFFYTQNERGCDQYLAHHKRCVSGFASPKILIDAARFDQSWKMSFGCEDRKEVLRSCLKEQYKKKPFEVPSDVSEDFGIKTPNAQGPSSPKSVR